MDNNISYLIEIKFENVGKWELENNSLKHSCQKLPPNQNALYSFVVDEKVVYVGKTTNTLKKRLNQYEKPHSSQKTNFNVNNEILKILKNKLDVEIYIFIDNNPQTIGQFELNKPAGLEDSIIQKLNPEWNNMGKGNHKTKIHDKNS